MAGTGSGKGNRKAGRDQDKCKRYETSATREKNRTRRLNGRKRKRINYLNNKFKQGKITKDEYDVKLQKLKNVEKNEEKLQRKKKHETIQKSNNT